MNTEVKKLNEVGKICVWFEERGYGFANVLQPDGTLRRYFLHTSNILSGTPVKDAVVRFQAVSTPKGPVAGNAEIFANRQELERHDAATALVTAAQTAQKGGSAATPKAGA